MNETIDFLRKRAVELRQLAALSPEVTDQLCHLADELEATAADLEHRGGFMQ